MPPLDDDDEETQALGDPVSPSSPSTGARCKEESEDPILDGETQVLDDPDGGFADDWGKTQVVDGYEDTAVDEERTLVLSDNGEEEGLEDDGTTQGEDGEGEDGGKEKEVVVDSDATTDEECDKVKSEETLEVLTEDVFSSNVNNEAQTI